jgi:hypothetical protein
MEAQGERMYSFYSFTTSTLDGDEWPVSRSGLALPPENDPGTHWIGGWVGLRAGLDREDKAEVPKLWGIKYKRLKLGGGQAYDR